MARGHATLSKHLRHLIGGAGAPLTALPPRFLPLLQPILRVAGPVYRRVGMGIQRLSVAGAEEARRCVRIPDTKTFFAFRHPSADDPPIVYQVVQHLLHHARRTPPIVLYGRDVPVWAGPVAAWLLPRIGAISVFHEQVKRDSLDEVYAAVRERDQAIVLAPEAQVTYHNYRVAPTQRGAAHLAVEAGRARAGTSSSVSVIPVGLEYRYPDRGNRQFTALLRRIGAEIGLPYRESNTDIVGYVWELYARLFQILEARYDVAPATVPSQSAPSPSASQLTPTSPSPTPNEPAAATPLAQRFNNRLNRLIHEILATGERAAGISPDQDSVPISRVFRLRRIYWERRFPPRTTVPFKKRLLDIAAMEARVTARHFQTVDLLGYLDFTYLTEAGLVPGAPMPAAGSSSHARLVEYLISIDDAIKRAQGHTIGQRYRWRGRHCAVRFGQPIAVAPPATRSHRHSSIQALQKQIEDALIEISVIAE